MAYISEWNFLWCKTLVGYVCGLFKSPRLKSRKTNSTSNRYFIEFPQVFTISPSSLRWANGCLESSAAVM